MISKLFKLFLGILIGDLTLSVEKEYDQNWQSFTSLRVKRKHLLYPHLCLFLYLLIFIFYVSVCIDLNHENKSQRLFQCAQFVVLLIERHKIQEKFASFLKPTEIQASQEILAELSIQ